MISTDKSVILASGSPRRKELLSLIIKPFTCISLDIDESYPSSMPAHEVAAHLATKKAEVAYTRYSRETILITADTTVICDHINCLKNQGLNKRQPNFLTPCPIGGMRSLQQHAYPTAINNFFIPLLTKAYFYSHSKLCY